MCTSSTFAFPSLSLGLREMMDVWGFERRVRHLSGAGSAGGSVGQGNGSRLYGPSLLSAMFWVLKLYFLSLFNHQLLPPHLDPSAPDSARTPAPLLSFSYSLLLPEHSPGSGPKPFCLELPISMRMVSKVVHMELSPPLPRLHNTSRLFPWGMAISKAALV